MLNSVPEDPTCTSVILDRTTYQRLSEAARTNPRQTRQQDLEQSKYNQQQIEVNISSIRKTKSFSQLK